MAGLRLDLRDEALKKTKSGVVPIVPGDPERSAIVQRVFAANPAKIMPPQYAHKTLSAAQKELIRRWVAEGAKYEGHWAYQPVQRPPVPQAAQGSSTAARNPVDAFIQERLARAGLHPSPEADRRTLIRRATLDLTGLPPAPEEVEAFLKDASADAYEKVVDRLLASPRYAEKQAMHWLDAIRYADTCGFHGDNPLPAWPYRDYVLRAFRDNKPFDVFTREQIAGDLMPQAATEQKIASAYNRMSRTSAEGGLQEKEYLAKYGADRVRTTSTVWMGATMGCSECHDHKFDPFTAKDFYSMKAFFADINETGLVPVRGLKAWGSKLYLPTGEQAARMQAIEADLAQTHSGLDARTQALHSERAAWEKRVLAQYAAGELAWRFQRPLSATTLNGATLTVYNDEPLDSYFYVVGNGGATLVTERKKGNGTVVAGGANPDNETYTVTFKPGEGAWTSLGVEVLQDESLPGVRFSRGADRFVLTEVDAELSPDGAAPGRKLPFVLATGEGLGLTPEHPAMAAIDGDPKTGWGVAHGEGRNPFLALRFGEDVHTAANSVITVRLRHDSEYRRATIGRFRVALSPGRFPWPETGDSGAKVKAGAQDVSTLTVAVDRGIPPAVLAALKIPEAERTEAQAESVNEFFAWSSPELQPAVIRAARLEAERNLLEARIAEVVYTESVEPRVTRILPRGNWMDDSGPIVEPAIPGFLGKLDTGGRRATRLDLANWIASRDNPFTARVFVNRLWREFFGTGISKALDDLGSQGEWPTHPELLDWLASEFMQPAYAAEGTHAWDVKHIIRTIVTSQTYRQSSVADPKVEERDPDNRLLARQSRFRVDAEVVHDIALSVSGLLAERFGGPSVFPYEPSGYLAAMNFPKREYSASHGDDLYRRGVYTQWQRTFLHPSLLTFDAPTREECTVNRVSSNTPLQALVLLNDPIYVEAARVFAAKALEQGGHGWKRQIDWAFVRALNRHPSKQESKILGGLHRASLKRFKHSQGEAQQLVSVGEAPVPTELKPNDLAAMTTVARTILNLHETITRN